MPLRRRLPRGELAQFGNLPPFPVQVEARKLPSGIGYLRFNIFLMPVLEPARKAIREFADAKGIIIDLRGNPGGIGGLAAGLARVFYEQETNLGAMQLRSGQVRFVAFPEEGGYRGPVALLTDEGSLSTSEVMAGGMQESGRAVVVGRPTGGKVLPSQIERLPDGGRLQYVVADFRTPKRVLLEGRGVLPDVPVALTRRLLREQADPILARAEEVLLQRAEAGSR